jgi:hypothetical protein
MISPSPFTHDNNTYWSSVINDENLLYNSAGEYMAPIEELTTPKDYQSSVGGH